SPAKYDLVRELVFDGVEYTSAEACTNARPRALALRDAARERALQQFGNRSWTERLVKSDALRVCREELFRHFGNNGLSSQAIPGPLARCLSDALVSASVDSTGL